MSVEEVTLVSLITLLFFGLAFLQWYYLRYERPSERMRQAAELAFEIVMGVEQAWRTGRIDRERRFPHAMELLRRVYPDLDPDLLAMLIERAVIVAKQYLVEGEDIEAERLQG